MATPSHAFAVHPTLTGTTVDTVTLTDPTPLVLVVERTGTNVLWVTVAGGGATPATPTSAGDGTRVVPAGGFRRLLVPGGGGTGAVVNVLGIGNAYSVESELL